ncbi:MAG: DUF45 domain-containing protein [Candidatus Gastranaerophilales bacterium]|nr:DUF45 domain-containing protein [Candidatus Gastranaerophilales bacterium]
MINLFFKPKKRTRNNQTKTEMFDEFTIKYKKLKFSKSIRISLKPNNQVLVTMPVSCPFDKAKEFLFLNIDKIKEFKLNTNFYTQEFKTKFDTLKIIPSDKLKTETRKNIVNFYYPTNLDFNCETIQKELKNAHLKAIKIEAKNYLIPRLEFLANKYGFKYNKVSLKNQKTRFGSCSFCNNINLNINLMNYGFDEIDYVLIHELVHTKIKNHSNNFWTEVEKYCPNYKNLRKNLKTIR